MVFRGLGDAFAIQALQAQIPALKPGVKILIQDVVMPEPGSIPLWKDRNARYDPACVSKSQRLMENEMRIDADLGLNCRSIDLALQCFSNGRERYIDEWKALLAAADGRFDLKKVFVPEESLLGVLEVHWKA